MRRNLFTPAIIWLIISIILLSLPGEDLPDNGVFSIPHFDKYVHFGMFLLLTVLFSYPYIVSGKSASKIYSRLIVIAIAALVYGILMEFVQKYFIPGRSFDVDDMLTDGLGCLGGWIVSRQYYSKKIGPDGNQGRNQN